jgi:hypothetical protein
LKVGYRIVTWLSAQKDGVGRKSYILGKLRRVWVRLLDNDVCYWTLWPVLWHAQSSRDRVRIAAALEARPAVAILVHVLVQIAEAGTSVEENPSSIVIFPESVRCCIYRWNVRAASITGLVVTANVAMQASLDAGLAITSVAIAPSYCS